MLALVGGRSVTGPSRFASGLPKLRLIKVSIAMPFISDLSLASATSKPVRTIICYAFRPSFRIYPHIRSLEPTAPCRPASIQPQLLVTADEE